MDKYGLLESSQGSSGSRKRFLQTYRPSLKRPVSTCLGESRGATSPLGLQETLDGLSRPQAAAEGKVISWMTAWGTAWER